MTSTMEFSENFVDLITITFTITSILAVFLLTVNYSLTAQQDMGTVRAVQFAEAMLSAPCLTESSGGSPVRAVLVEQKLLAENQVKLSCMDMPSVRAQVVAGELNFNWGAGGDSQAEFPVAVKLADGTIIPGKLTVWA